LKRTPKIKTPRQVAIQRIADMVSGRIHYFFLFIT
jgi:hypothetical protein